MFHSIGALAFIVPLIIYLIIFGFVIWLVVRLIRSNEKIAFQSERIANALIDKNEIERKKMQE
jgi:flagellar biogenesis protein FliO